MKRPTIADIARRAGVSTGAVSYALSGRPGVSVETRERIVRIADEVGWRPNAAARALSVSRAHAVSLVIARPARTLGVEPFFMQFIAGVEAELSRHRTALLLQVVEDHAAALESTRQWWAERRIDGVFVTDVFRHDDRIAALERANIPAVLVGRPRPDCAIPGVWSDDAAATAAVVDYLATLGHRRIARVAGLPALDHTQVRTEAFLAAADRHGLAAAPVVETDYSWEQGAQATRALLTERTRPTAIVYDNDMMALAALGVARELGVAVPTELSIVAGDDSQLCALAHPSVTALSRDIPAYGAHAARVLQAVVDGQHPDSFQDATPLLTPRASTAPAPRARRGGRS